MHFPAEKTVIYNYYADVKAGTVEPVQYASEFALAGQLHIRKDVSDPSLNNAYYIKLHNLKYGMFNGMVGQHQPIEVVHELGEATQQIQEPFVIVYNENGKVTSEFLMRQLKRIIATCEKKNERLNLLNVEF